MLNIYVTIEPVLLRVRDSSFQIIILIMFRFYQFFVEVDIIIQHTKGWR